MPYVINKSDGQQLLVLEDGTINTETSLGLVGRNYVGYGETQNENFVFLLENFSNTAPPLRPLEGQLWFDSGKNVMNVYDGNKWVLIAAATISDTPPLEPNAGAIWYRSTDNSLHIYNGTSFTLIGPDSIAGYNTTRPKSRTVKDTNNIDRPIIELIIDGTTIAIVSAIDFTLNPTNPIPGFRVIKAGMTVNSQTVVSGSIDGNAFSATKLRTARSINGVEFDGTSDITISAPTSATLARGDYIIGSNFNGSNSTTWSVDASSENEIGKIVARDSAGNFRATTITADLVGNVIGNVQIDNGFSTFNEVRAQRFVGRTLAGNAATADKLTTPRLINLVPFDGSQDVTIPASAATLTGTFISSNVVSSSLEQVGTLLNLAVNNDGITVGNAQDIKIAMRGSNPLIKSQISGKSIDIELTDNSYINSMPRIRFLSSGQASDAGGQPIPTLTKEGSGEINLGTPSRKWNKFFTNEIYSSTAYVNNIAPETGATTTLSGNLVITGDMTVQGNVTAINTTETTVEDKTLTIAFGSINAAAADGSGLIIDAAGASLLYAVSGDKWIMNKPLDMGSNDITTTGLFQGLATSARYADLAENYVADKQYEPGTVLELGGEFEVTIAENETARVAGVVSSAPAYLMNSSLQGKYVVPLALQGRVPCKVQGKICKGDILVSAGNGYAKAVENPKIGTIVGKSLEDFNETVGIIEVLVGRF